MADFIQQIVARESNISDSTQNMYISLTESFYCDLILYEKVVEDNWVVAKDQQTIWPGKEYRVRVLLSQNRNYNPDCMQRDIKVDPEIRAYLTCTEDAITIVTIDSDCSLSKGKTISFTFAVPQCCPRCKVTFSLSYNDPSNKDILKLATSMSIALKGTYNLVDQVFVENANVDLNSPLPEYVAMLYVEYQEEGRFCLHAWNLTEEPKKFELYDWKPKKLADILAMIKSDHTGDIDAWEIIHSFSRYRGLQDLNQWFRRLIASYGEQLCVVISEYNDLEIPWEILALDHKSYLGSRAMVVHWREVRGYSELRKLRISQVKNQGTVVAYFNNQEPDMEVSYPEQKHLEAMQKNRMRVQYYSHLKDLRQYLLQAETLNDISLVYLGCYGNESMDTETRKKLFNPIKKLNLARVKEHIDPRPLVFVNACDSACIDSEGNGPIDVWLALLASGYLGTRGPVGPTYASKVAKRVMEANGRSIAEVLKQLRVEAVQKSLQNEEAQEEFIYAFMYIYYGNPLLYLDLKDGKEPEENV